MDLVDTAKIQPWRMAEREPLKSGLLSVCTFGNVIMSGSTVRDGIARWKLAEAVPVKFLSLNKRKNPGKSESWPSVLLNE